MITARHIFVVLIGLVLYSNTQGQFQHNYQYAPVQDTVPDEVSQRLKMKLLEKKKSLSGNSSKERNFIYSLYEKQNDRLVNYFNDDYFITHDALTDYLKSVLQNILKGNPDISKEVSIYAFCESSPNAFTFWDGTIGITLSLLSRMETEDEIAFVICHELAHYSIGHTDQRIHDLAKVNYDPEIEKQIKTIRSGNYDKYTKLKKLYKDLTLSIYSHTRDQEFQADSLGFIYLLHTHYDPGAATRLMGILDSIDTPPYKKNIDLKHFFSFKNYPFKDSWLDYSKSSMLHRVGDEEYGSSDTIRTHPDCKKRIIALRKLMEENHVAEHKMQANDQRAREMAVKSEMELVHSEYHFKHYAKSLFMSLSLIDRFPENIYLHAMAVENLYKVYLGQKNHQSGKSVPLPDSRYPESYDRLLSFLQKLRLMEVASIGYNFAVTQNVNYFSDEEYLYAFWMISHVPASELSPSLIMDDYKQKFPGGRYNEVMSLTK